MTQVERAYPGGERVCSLEAVGGHDGVQELMNEGPDEYNAIPISQRQPHQKLQAHLPSTGSFTTCAVLAK